jgi:glycosyltransferase involved in cell wall biosynthesis
MLIPMNSTKKIYWTDTPNLDRKEWIGLRGYIRRIIVKVVFNVFDEVWSTGTPGCEALEKLGCKKEKIRSFTFFFDLSRYSNKDPEKLHKAAAFKARNSNEDTEIIFLSAGQVIQKKRFENAIEAISKLNNGKAILWIAGTGPVEEELKSFATKLNVLKQIKFLGWLQQDEVELAFMSSDVFVHPSHFDPFPIVVLDAMTWGKPVIATQESGSAKDRVVHGKSGFLYPTGKVDELTKHMKFFIENKHEIKYYGLESRKTACAYPVEWAVDKFKSII